MHYPEGPKNVPAELVKVSGKYKWQVFNVLLAMALFVAMYFAMVAGAGFLIYYSAAVVPFPDDGGAYAILFKLGIIAASVMLFVFMVKFMFKRNKIDMSGNHEIKAEDHPELFAFLKQLCDDTKTVLPKRIFVSAEINAAVFYNSTFWSLFFPVRKNLLIGLGLVNAVNLSELKAVLAHEFGHFSQSSMRLGSYVYMANNIIYDMVYERDSWDDLMARWKNSDIRLAVFGLALGLVIGSLRLMLKGCYQVINIFHASLSRQMEFHADLVSVSVAGSNGIVNALSKLDQASTALEQAYEQLQGAADHDLYSRDIFFHQKKNSETLFKKMSAEEKASFGTSKGKDLIFKADDDTIANMYASHPPNPDRETNAKRVFIDAPKDETTPWVLFNNQNQLKEQVSRIFYQHYLARKPAKQLNDEKEVNDFIQHEIAESTFDERYLNTYEDRFICHVEDDCDKLAREYGYSASTLKKDLDNVYRQVLPEKMKEINSKHDDLNQIVPILAGQSKKKEVSIQNRLYSKNELEGLFEKLAAEIETAQEALDDYDKRIFTIYHLAAKKANKQPQLKKKYQAQYDLQGLLKTTNEAAGRVEELLELLQQGLDDDDVEGFIKEFEQCRFNVGQVLIKADSIDMPQLKHMGAFEKVRPFLLSEPFVDAFGEEITGEMINQFLGQLDSIRSRLKRLHFKHLGSLVKFQEELEKSC